MHKLLELLKLLLQVMLLVPLLMELHKPVLLHRHF
jgi:hypothetical protein